jgi:hypothetical protein
MSVLTDATGFTGYTAESLDVFHSQFRRSRKDNLYRRLSSGTILTIFPDRKGGYRWCIFDDIEAGFSDERFPSEEKAIECLWEMYFGG